MNFRFFALFPLRKDRGPSFEQTWIPFMQGCFLPVWLKFGSCELKIQEKPGRGGKIGLPHYPRWICYFNFAYIIHTALLSIKFKQCIIWSLSIYIIYIILYNYIVKVYLPSNIRFNLTNQDYVNWWNRRHYLNICADLL